jgi:hypothetical protein
MRNLKYFIGFLWFTSIHGAATWAITLTTLLMYPSNGFQKEESITKSVMIFAGVISLALLVFCLVQVFDLAISNTVSNEELRHRWNGHVLNKNSV